MKKVAVVHCGKVIILKYYRLSHSVVTLDVYRDTLTAYCYNVVFIRRWSRLVMRNLITYHLCLCVFRRQRELDKQNLKQFFDERQRVRQVS